MSFDGNSLNFIRRRLMRERNLAARFRQTECPNARGYLLVMRQRNLDHARFVLRAAKKITR